MNPHRGHWKVVLSDTWDVLGPFPIHAREQYFISPAYPIDLSQAIDYTRTWPSSYADGGKVGWARVRSESNGNLKVSFPNVRWQALRSTEGWAALQHHALLHSTFLVYPPDEYRGEAPPHLLVQLIQGSFFSVMPSQRRESIIPQWYTGNIYDLPDVLPRAVPLPGNFAVLRQGLEPVKYDIFISGDYEIRLFGDPCFQGSQVPVQQLRIEIQFDNARQPVIREPSQDVICDFVEGKMFGDAIGVGLRVSSSSSGSTCWIVEDVLPLDSAVGKVNLHLQAHMRLMPSQMRVIPIRITQIGYFRGDRLPFTLKLRSPTNSNILTVTSFITVNQITAWGPSFSVPIKATYFYAQSIPTAFIAIPPLSQIAHAHISAVIALHGAGVDILRQDFWVNALPRQQNLWYVVPTGRTTWGLDWHGPSTNDAWMSLQNLASILGSQPQWSAWKPNIDKPVILLGHSNGGQGTWHMATHYPDRVTGMIAAAAYIKSQAYISLSMSRSAHFIDPMLRAILETSLTPDDNDLHLSNLKHTRVLAIHGGDDENVPVWHSRELISDLLSKGQEARFRLHEEPGQGHWYPSVFLNNDVKDFFHQLSGSERKTQDTTSFTLTVASPLEYGPMQGFRIEQVLVPGRLAQLHIDSRSDKAIHMRTHNVHSFSLCIGLSTPLQLYIDGQEQLCSSGQEEPLRFQRVHHLWVKVDLSEELQPASRLQEILVSPAPIAFVVKDDDVTASSIALRLIHDLSAYHRLDSQLLYSSELLANVGTPRINIDGNVVYIGRPNDTFAQYMLTRTRTGVMTSPDGQLVISGRPASGSGLASAFFHPHPSSPKAKFLFLLATDNCGLERLARLFPIRTGVPVPSWIIVSKEADEFGAAGICGAGIWNYDWQYNPISSWIDT
ncbi:hypothetical protein AX16_008651 [Volvariella volvacea WC 439]|nr:hypothetical protein AX16_008651 [Volvariella volvacea WC 439]